MRRIHLETHRRLLGNGYCTRPVELDCAFEPVCETCVHFATGPALVPVLLRQRDHAAERHQANLVTVYDRLLERIETEPMAELVLLGGEVCRRLLATDASVVAWSRRDLPNSFRHVAPSSRLRRSATMCALLDDTSNRSESNPLIASTGRGCSSTWMCLSPARRTRALPATCGKLDPLAQPFLSC
jgi:hypothetical protein